MTVITTGEFMRPMTPEEFVSATNVSRETLARLEIYAALLRKWQPKINLVGRSTLDDLWRRHMLDSAQLFPLVPPQAQVLVDLGSGAGFPGLVLAIMGAPRVHLIESDGRKGTFLREVIRATGAPATVHTTRIEAMDPPIAADVVTARALASLDKLVPYAARFVKNDGFCLFLKGQKAQEELTNLEKNWTLALNWVPSITDPTGSIVKLERIRSKNDL